MKCTYRATTECRMPRRINTSDNNCELCLMGQQADEIGLLTSAVMNLSMEKTEKETETMFGLEWDKRGQENAQEQEEYE